MNPEQAANGADTEVKVKIQHNDGVDPKTKVAFSEILTSFGKTKMVLVRWIHSTPPTAKVIAYDNKYFRELELVHLDDEDVELLHWVVMLALGAGWTLDEMFEEFMGDEEYRKDISTSPPANS